MFSEQRKEYSIYESRSGNSLFIYYYIGNHKKLVCSFILDGKKVDNHFYCLQIRGNIYIKVQYLEILRGGDIVYNPDFEIFVNKDISAVSLK
jgi:hypothetical protein